VIVKNQNLSEKFENKINWREILINRENYLNNLWKNMKVKFIDDMFLDTKNYLKNL
jgi:hypothetical protein